MKLIIALLTFSSVAAFLPPHAGRTNVAVSHHGHDEEHDITFKDSNPVLADVFNAVEALFSAPTPVGAGRAAPEGAVVGDVFNAVEALFSAPTPVGVGRVAPEDAVVGGFAKSITDAFFGVEALTSATTAGRSTRNAHVTQSPLGHGLADAFFGTFEGNDYPDLGFPTGFSGDPHKHTKDAWDYKLDFSKQAKVQAKVQPTVVRPRRGSAFPAAVPTEELLADLVDGAASSPIDAYLANEIKRAYAGSGKNDYPGLEKATGYTGKVNRNKGQRSD